MMDFEGDVAKRYQKGMEKHYVYKGSVMSLADVPKPYISLVKQLFAKSCFASLKPL